MIAPPSASSAGYGFFLCYPSRAQSSPALRLFIEVAGEVLGR